MLNEQAIGCFTLCRNPALRGTMLRIEVLAWGCRTEGYLGEVSQGSE